MTTSRITSSQAQSSSMAPTAELRLTPHSSFVSPTITTLARLPKFVTTALTQDFYHSLFLFSRIIFLHAFFITTPFFCLSRYHIKPLHSPSQVPFFPPFPTRGEEELPNTQHLS